MYLSSRWKSTKFLVLPGKFGFLILCSILYLFNLLPIHGFNVDIENPLIFNGTQSGSHFGYSVAILQNAAGVSKLVIAAPKFSEEKENNPGMLYECQISQDDPTVKFHACDKEVLKNLSDYTITHVRAYNKRQWLGVAMDVNEKAGKFVVCAHRWCEIVSKGLRMVGACFLLSTSNYYDLTILAPLLDSAKKNGVFYQGMAQFGTSAQFSKNNKDILFGAPGIYQGKGGFVIKDFRGKNSTTVDYSDSVNHHVHSEEEYEDSMVGYSITSGRFFMKQVQIAVGGPGPSTLGLGKVLIYLGDQLIGRYSGSQYGGGFGSSLASGDFFGGDGNDDLVVGAPMEYDIVNEGRVYILTSNGIGAFMDEKIVLVGSNVPGAHFGTTVANIGDLNVDGFDDIAVGAPYEDGCGAVYIYYGSSDSIDETRKQKISGKSLDPGLRGFGISFSKPKDVDNNGYLDFAVGAFLSDQAVLLHTRPVIKTNTMVKSSPPDLNPQDTDCFGEVYKAGCVDLSVNINLIGKAFDKVELLVMISVDVDKPDLQKRAILNDDEDKTIHTELGLNNHFHKKYPLKTRKTKDLFNPVVVHLTVIVKSNSTEKSISPVQDLMEPSTIKYEIPFLNDCGADKLCAVDLQTGLKWLGTERNNVLLIGGEHQFKIGVTVANGNEPAYQPVGILEYPDYIDYVSFSAQNSKEILSCTFSISENTTNPENTHQVKCNYNNPLRKGKYYYELTFDIRQDSQKVGQFSMKFSVTSEGFELVPESNEKVLEIKMRKKAVLTVNTDSEPQHILVKQEVKRLASDIRDITHVYGFYNNGPSDLKKGNFTLRVNKVKNLLSDLSPQFNSSESSTGIECRTDTFKEMEQFYEMKCHFKNWGKESYLSVEVYMKMDISKLDSELPIIKSELIMHSVKDKDYVNDIAIEGKTYTVTTNISSGQPKPVETWIIVVCIILGILLLLGFVAGLWKCGFFKRQKVHHVGQHGGSMRQEVQPDPDSQPLNNQDETKDEKEEN